MTTFCRFDYPSFVDFRMFNNTDCPFCTLIFMYNKNDNKKTFYKIAEKAWIKVATNLTSTKAYVRPIHISNCKHWSSERWYMTRTLPTYNVHVLWLKLYLLLLTVVPSTLDNVSDHKMVRFSMCTINMWTIRNEIEVNHTHGLRHSIQSDILRCVGCSRLVDICIWTDVGVCSTYSVVLPLTILNEERCISKWPFLLRPKSGLINKYTYNISVTIDQAPIAAFVNHWARTAFNV